MNKLDQSSLRIMRKFAGFVACAVCALNGFGAASMVAAAETAKAEEPAFESRESGEWPQYGYDAGCRFATPGSLASVLKPKWVFKRAPPAARIASIIIHGDRVLVECTGDQNGDAKIGDPANNPYLYGLDAATGAKAWEWSHKHDMGIGCTLAVSGTKLFYNDDGFGWVDVEKGGGNDFGSSADSWGYINVDAKAGLVVKSNTWRVDNPETSIEGFGLDGSHRWTALNDNGQKTQDRMAFASLCQGAGLVFVSVEWSGPSPKKHKQGLYALKQADGSEAWGVEGDWGGVSCDGNFVYCVLKDAKGCKLCCLTPGDGKPQWSANVGQHVHHPPALGRGMCVLVTDGGTLLAVPSEGAKAGKALAWQGQTEPPLKGDGVSVRNSVLAIAEGAGKNGVLVVANGKSVRCLDLKRGSPLGELPWDPALGAAENPAIADGCLVVNGSEGVMCYGPPPDKKDKAKAK